MPYENNTFPADNSGPENRREKQKRKGGKTKASITIKKGVYYEKDQFIMDRAYLAVFHDIAGIGSVEFSRSTRGRDHGTV